MKVAFVAPFFGAKAAGGAESECRNTAIRLAQSGVDVEIITTCVQDLHHDWNEDHYPPGTSSEDGMVVHRFQTNRVNLDPFGPLNCRLIAGHKLSPEEEKQFMAMHINSFDMYRFIEEHKDDYDWICFIPYLFGTTYHATRLCPDKAVLIPCLHDEGYARMDLMKEMFGRVAKVVFHAEAEMRLAERLYGSLSGRGVWLGEGVETEFDSDDQRFRETYGIDGPFLLYAGRKDETKNVHTLVDYFTRFKAETDSDLSLIMIGPESIRIEPGAEAFIRDLGFVPVQDKKDGYSAAEALCQPSLNESFSIVMMESWICGRPCIVSGGCAVTKEHVVKSGGGFYFDAYEDFKQKLAGLAANPEQAAKMGEAGRKYVLDNFAWDRIITRFREEVFV